MKINWGTGIVIAIVAFMAFILYFVITMSVDNKFTHDLVTENYYKKELGFQDEINAQKNANNLKEKVTFAIVKQGIEIRFPSNFKPENIKGKVSLYRPSNKQLDFEIPISLSNTYLLVPEKRLVDGRWDIIISFKYNKKDYLIKENIIF